MNSRYKLPATWYTGRMTTVEELEQKYDLLFPHLNERQQHLVAALDADQLGRGGIALVARVTGLSRPTLYRAIQSLQQPPLPVERIRHPGAGRKGLAEQDPHDRRQLFSAPATGLSQDITCCADSC